MEVQDRPLPAAVPVARANARTRPAALARLLPLAAFVLALAVSASVVFAQPVRSPWWTYADADAAYTASSLNLLLGVPVRYLDHPGLPLEELGAVAFGAEQLVRGESRRAFVDDTLLDLDSARPVFRGLAALIYLLGAALSFLLLARLYRHWLWGLAGALLWIATPGLAWMSIQFRPDVALTVTLLVFAYLVGRAVERRSPWHFAGAGVALGLATMVKMHAAGAAVSLVLAALWRPPEPGWRARARMRALEVVRRRRVALSLVAAVWLALAVAFNVARAPFSLTGRQVEYGVLVAAVGATGVAAALRVRALAGLGLAAAGVVVGLALPITLDVPEGLQSLLNIRDGLTGGGINQTISPFTAPLGNLVQDPLKQALAVFVVAGVAALVGLVRRDPRPAVWFAGAAVLGVMAEARLAATHYFAPAFILAVPAALWLFRERRALGAALVWVLVAYAAWPVWENRRGPAHDAAAFAAVVAPAKRWLGDHQRPPDVAVVPSYWPFADSRYFELVQLYVNYTPDYPYRVLPATSLAAAYAESRGLRFRYYVGPQASELAGEQRVSIDLGDYTLRPVGPLVAELVHGPGTDTPWDHPDAPYDPWTGYFKDPQGRYWNRQGQQIVAPARRRFLAAEQLWVDAYGDLWNAAGDHVGTRPELRTVP